MRGKNTIIINGRQYDAVTGLATDGVSSVPLHADKNPRMISDFGVTTPRPTAHKAVTKPEIHRPAASKAAVTTLQKSKTLRREAVRRPVGTHESIIVRPAHSRPVIAQSQAISKFADHPQSHTRASTPSQASTPATTRPVHKPAMVAAVRRATAPATVTGHHTTVALSSRQLKEQLISEKLSAVNEHKKQSEHAPKRRLFAAHPRAASVMASCFALVILGGYLTYLNMPNLSVRVAAAQAGVNARFPEYRPDGYRFNGPIAYAPGEVTMNFLSNGGKQAYEIKQKNSSWDSQAVLDNYVTKQSKTYLTYSEQGLTVYTYENKAAWVNGGILYTINGDAPLSNEQVLRIAASM